MKEEDNRAQRDLQVVRKIYPAAKHTWWRWTRSMKKAKFTTPKLVRGMMASDRGRRRGGMAGTRLPIIKRAHCQRASSESHKSRKRSKKDDEEIAEETENSEAES